MRVHHLNCGTMCPMFGRLVGNRVGPLARGHLVCHCLAVELHDGGFALLDTGMGTADVAAPVRRLGFGFVHLAAPLCSVEETALAQLAKLGVAARDVRLLIPTHLDLDHAGGIPDFPAAEVHILRRELAAALARATLRERERYRPRQWRDAHFVEHEPGGERWFGFDGVRAVPGTRDEILLVPLHGHTRGHAGIAVRSPTGWLLHAGDAYFHHDEVHSPLPRCPLALRVLQEFLQTDRTQRVDNQLRLRELASAHGGEVTVFCAHDPDELALAREALSSRV